MKIQDKLRSAEDAAALVRDTDSLVIPLGPGIPSDFLHALGRRERFERLVVFGALLIDFFEVFTRPGVHLRSGFFGPVERALRAAGHDVQFLPADFRRFANIAERMHPRVMATMAAPPDADGNLSLSLHAGATVEELGRCGRDPDRVLIVEINEKLPRTLGLPPDAPHTLSLADVDVVIRSEREPFYLPDAAPTDEDRRIAELACRYVPDGATLQTGIGAIPTQIADLLAEGAGGDYGIHSEMFTTGLMRLHRAGKISNRKGIYDGVSITTFAAGTPELYEWLDGNEAVRFLPVALVNTPSVISSNRDMVAMNGALALDLAGQVAADTVGALQYSGIGGHMDFTAGAGLSATGRSLICLPSTALVDGVRISRITAEFPRGTIVTTPRHELDVVITEHGAAELADRTVDERAEALIEIAHPDFRDELSEAHKSGGGSGR